MFELCTKQLQQITLGFGKEEYFWHFCHFIDQTTHLLFKKRFINNENIGLMGLSRAAALTNL